MSTARETRLSQRVMKHLRQQYDAEVRKVHVDQYGATGEPDLDGCIRGRAVKIELKVVGNKPRPSQLARMRAWARAGALVGWCTSVGEVDELLTHLDDLSWENPQLAGRASNPTVIDTT